MLSAYLLSASVLIGGIAIWVSAPPPEDEPQPMSKLKVDAMLTSASISAASLGKADTAMAIKEAVEEYGFVKLDGFLSSEEVTTWRARAERHVCEEAPQLEFGYCLCDLQSQEPFASILEKLLSQEKVKHVFKALTGEVGFRFAGHSDISCDKVVFWHKDKLNGKYASYQQLSPWSEGGEHKIYKLLLYLQDHSNDSEALRVVPGSHLESEVTLKGVHYAQLHPKLGDALVIDQRVTHTGQMRVQGSPHRILVSLGFGANNIWTDQFQAGTEARQAADTEAMRSRATQPSWQRDSMRVLHDNILRPALGMVYSGFSPLRVLKLASRVYG
mmetsp:Transcript_52793/g.123475  ORF Transcript_52793/g.123475 Transcript_52793/m.123475 type:complete len:329 (+) Transcript_52793:76-1062(+)